MPVNVNDLTSRQVVSTDPRIITEVSPSPLLASCAQSAPHPQLTNRAFGAYSHGVISVVW